MKRKYIRNQKGLTLVELLATITISTLILGLLWGTLFTTFKNNEITQSHINLRQEANQIVSKLRELHKQGNYNVCYEYGNIYFDPDKKDSLAKTGVKLEGIESSTVLFENGGNKIDETNPIPCTNMLVINTNIPLLVTLTLVDEDGNNFEVDTVIDRL